MLCFLDNKSKKQGRCSSYLHKLVVPLDYPACSDSCFRFDCVHLLGLMLFGLQQ